MTDRSRFLLDQWQDYLNNATSDVDFIERWRRYSDIIYPLRDNRESFSREARNLQQNLEAEDVRMRFSEAARHIDNAIAQSLSHYESTLRSVVSRRLNSVQERLEHANNQPVYADNDNCFQMIH